MNAQFDVDGFVTVVNGKDYGVPQALDINGGVKDDGHLDWPALDVFFDYDGVNDLIVDFEAQMGSTYQTFRTYVAVTFVPFPGGVCTSANFGGCVANTSIGSRQMDSIYGGNVADPAPGGFTLNPAPIVHVMEFEFATLRSDARSRYYDTATDNPDYISPILTPLVQAGGAAITLSWSASSDGIVEDVPFTSDINACDGFRYIRWRCAMHSNLFTGARARLELMQIPFVIP
jgi:hypothetical protein